MRLAAECCFVFSILMSLLFRENKATSAPEMVKASNNKAANTKMRKVVPVWINGQENEGEFGI